MQKSSAKSDPLQLKEQKWGKHKQELLAEFGVLTAKGLVVVYSGGSTKSVRGWMQAGYGVWFGHKYHRNFSAHVPAHEWQSINRGELKGVPHATLSGVQGEFMVVVLDSE